jgi:flagellar hook-associated protein 1
MPSTFFGMEIGRRALSASQLAIQVTGNNTANVNTPGYSRQVVQFSQTDPYTESTIAPMRPGQLGTGVTIAAITRVRDEFMDRRIYGANSAQYALNTMRDVVARVEQAYGEPSTAGIGQLMTNFFNSFSDLSANPESGALRSTVRNRAQTLVSNIRAVDATLEAITPDIQAQVETQVKEINDLSSQIALMNKQIRGSVALGDNPNDLLDARGALMDKLSQLVDVQIINTVNPNNGKGTGEVQINVGGYLLVQGDATQKLPTTITTLNNTLGLKTANGDEIPLRGGSLFGLVKATTLVSGYRSDLNTLVSGVITSVNNQHRVGYGLDGVTARDFFSGTSAADIAVSTTVQTDLNAIAAATPPTPPSPFAPGNGDNARALAGISHAPTIGTFTLNGYYNDRIATIGTDLRAFKLDAENQEKVLNQLQNLQSSASGVSLDEEMTNMLQYQRVYQAAARVLNIMDDTLNRIVNGLGTTVG